MKMFFSKSLIVVTAFTTLSLSLVAQTYFAGTNAGSGNTGTQVTGVGYNALSTNNSGNFNTALGYQSLKANSVGVANVSVGTSALLANTSGSFNVGIGYLTQLNNTNGNYNITLGTLALGDNISGMRNIGIGSYALYRNTSSDNTAVGDIALTNTNSGSHNTAVGSGSMATNIAGSNNSAFGYRAAYNTNAGPNEAFGHEALYANTSGYWNSAFGYRSLYSSTSALYNVAMGGQSMYTTTTGAKNIGIGFSSLFSNTTGMENTSIGYAALFSNTTDAANTALGFSSLRYINSGGGGNTAIGHSAGLFPSTLSAATLIGSYADVNANGLTNTTALGYAATVNASNKTVIGNSATTVFGYYGTLTALSDGRFKKSIEENVPGMEFINKLRPVTYNLDIRKLDKHIYGEKAAEYEKTMAAGIASNEKIRYTGFIAQEVEQAANAVKYDFSGVVKPQNEKDNYGLDYSEFVVPIVKGMQEQYKMIDEQKALIKQQQIALDQAIKKIESLSGQLQDLKECCSTGNLPMDKGNAEVPLAKLLNAVPNPTSNNSTIHYFLPESATKAVIELKNVEGKKLQIFNLDNIGNSSINVQTDKLTSGSYYYSLIVDGVLIETKILSVAKY